MTLPLLGLLCLGLLVLPRLMVDRPATGDASALPAWPAEVSPLLKLFWWINRAYCLVMHRLIVLNTPALPDAGPAILIANHTSGVDHFILQAGCRRVLGFMIAKEFYDLPVGNWFCQILGCIPVNRNGKDMAATRTALRALADGRVLPIFPEGKITRTSGREFAEGKAGAAFLAMSSRAPIIPAYIRGTPIVDKVMPAWYTPSRARVIFGPPVDLSDLLPTGETEHAEERALLKAITERLMDAIKALRPVSLAMEPEA